MTTSEKQSDASVETRNEVYVFSEKVKLTATVSYVHDQPIVHTKTIVFDYDGHHFDMSNGESSFYRLLTAHALRRMYVVELINYLSRIHNGRNVFDIYKVERKDADMADLNRYVFGSEQQQKSLSSTAGWNHPAVQNDDFCRSADLDLISRENYIDGLCDDGCQFKRTELYKHVNPNTPIAVRSFDDFRHVPVFGYVHPTLAINRGEAVPVMHLAVVVNILAHQSSFSLLNSQSAIAMFGNMMKAKRFDETVEEVTIQSLEEAKRYIEHLLDENRSLKTENRSLSEKVDDLLQKVNEQKANNEEMLQTIKKQEALLKEQMEVVGIMDTRDIERKAESKKLMKKVDHLTALNEAQTLDHAILLERTTAISQQVQSLNVSNHDANRTLDLRWILYTSESNPTPPDYVKGTPEDCIWIMSHARETKNVRLPVDAITLLNTEMVNRSIYEDAITSLIPEAKRGKKNVDLSDVPNAPFMRLWRRHILVKRDTALQFIERVQTYLTSRGVHPDINIERLRAQLHVSRVKRNVIEATVDKTLEKEQWKKDFIARNDRYVYHTARWRRLYAKTANGYTHDLTDTDPWYVRTGRGGTDYVKLSFGMLTEMRYRSNGDSRITYE